MPIQKDIALLDPKMQAGVKKLLAISAAEGIPCAVVETRRELAVQMAYYSRGRCAAQYVKDYFKAAGLWAISDAEAVVVSTKTLDSLHILGLAVDIAPTQAGKVWYDAPAEIWSKLYVLAEDECGLDACYGGQWNSWKWDRPHFEFHTEVFYG